MKTQNTFNDKDEVKKIETKLRTSMKNQRALLYELEKKKAYLLFNCKSMSEYLDKRFPEMHKSHAYRLLASARVEEHINPNSPIGEIKESVLRPLTSYKPKDIKTIWKQACKLAKEDEKKAPTAKHVKNAILLVASDEDLENIELIEQEAEILLQKFSKADIENLIRLLKKPK